MTDRELFIEGLQGITFNMIMTVAIVGFAAVALGMWIPEIYNWIGV
ncbi:MAG: hypothetical protein GY749_22910 [Desulfobacteraceae bacterium]|nr:hypothetical protein [Desulfobacteraceae bacterium]